MILYFFMKHGLEKHLILILMVIHVTISIENFRIGEQKDVVVVLYCM